ncbi:lysoplasmalogenase [Abyssalbus ytuae]|uniref:Lysoplasmalogenase n=1 Tax=Abyssalbus ytuae TaxID=2926907 RepID=A0A9E6ZP94_9FLAO|nr:lysoplasmalogenase [Abyssalbus ytuae]UOB18030.1 lysoplasmalogenase [Abyssalbus ytuae]
MKYTTFIIIYILILTAELISTVFPSLNIIHYLAKPLLMVSLSMFFFNTYVYANNVKKLILLALIFSLMGDILLMLTYLGESFFIFGLIAFLSAHLMYILAFSTERNRQLKPFLPLLILLAYGGVIFLILMPTLNHLLIPVTVYILVILTMVLFAYLRKGKVNARSFFLVLSGALFFVLSDSLLAINKFKISLPLSGIWIMTTYAVAQLLIVLGIIKNQSDRQYK